MNIVRIALTAFLTFSIATVVLVMEVRSEGSNRHSVSTSTADRNERSTLDGYGRLPLAFIPNAGQTDSRVHFSSHAGGASFFFTPGEAVFAFTGNKKSLTLRLSFVGANPSPQIVGSKPSAGRVNYLIGRDPARWRTGLATYEEIVYRDLWPGIDLAFRGGNGELKYEFHLAPTADPRAIRLAYRGADRLALGSDGELLIHTALDVLRDSAPMSYQEIAGQRIPVASRYSLAGNSYSIVLGSYDLSRRLVIDPGLSYSTFLGGGQADVGLAIAVDSFGSAYIAGTTSASNFPTTVGAFDTTFNGEAAFERGDVFVTKLNPQGSALEYSTYLGGSAGEGGNGIAVDGGGNAYVIGSTTSSNFPTTTGAFDTTYNGGQDAFVTKLDATGSFPLYSTYLGGSTPGILCSPSPCPDDSGAGVAIDQAGNLYVTGATRSANFPTTPGAFDTSYTSGANYHVFVTKLNPSGSALIYSTYLGGGTGESGAGIAIDDAGNAFVTGVTSSVNFPTTPGAFDTTRNSQDAFVAKVNAEGTGLIYSTFLGGSSGETGTGIAIDPAGHAYVTGWGTSADFPTTPGAFDPTYNPGGNGFDAFVTKLNMDGSGVVYSTFVGGSSSDQSFGINVNTAGIVCVTGQTSSTDFPTTPGALDTSLSGADVFVTKLNGLGSAALYSTYLGGGGGDGSRAIAVDSSGSVYITGNTFSNNFPITPGAFQSTIGGFLGGDAFVTKFSNQPPSSLADTITTDEDNAVTISVLANDTDGDGDLLTVSDATQGANGSLTINPDNTVKYTPAANFNGTDSFDYTVMDTWGDTDTATVSITINPVNDPPVVSDSSASTDEDSSVQINLVGTDVDNTELSYAVISSPANGTLGPLSGSNVTYTPNANFNGLDSFTFKANDGMVDSNVATVSITVVSVNDVPQAIDDSASTNEETAVIIGVLANDTDVEGNSLSVTAVTQGANGAVIINPDNSITYTPGLNFVGTDSFTYSVSDGNGGTDSATVNVTVANVNDTPTAEDDAVTVVEDSVGNTINVLGNDSDIDRNPLSVASVTQGSHGAVTNNSTSVSYTPASNYFGPDAFTYTVSDGQGGSDTATVNVMVSNVNDAPLAVGEAYNTNANTSLVVAARGVLTNDVDIDSDALSAVLVTNVSNGTLTLNPDGSFTYSPTLNFFGPDSFTYRASDGLVTSNLVTVQITVVNNLIVFSSTRDANSEIYVMGVDGTSQTRVTNHPAEDAFPAWSPDRSKIAFISDRNGSYEVYVMNANGTSPVRLTTGGLVEGAIDWSPDGSRLAFTSNRDGNPEIYVMNVDGTGLTRLAKSRAIDTSPRWSPDGSKIAFASDRKRSFEIYVMNSDGTGLTRLTNNAFTSVGPAWSPDGTKIAFTTNRDGNFEIYVMNTDGSGPTRLTNNAAMDEEPSWSSNGNKVIFTSLRDGNAEIYVMNADGTGQTRLTTDASPDTSPR